MLRDHGGLFGPVASAPTLWRTLNELDDAASPRVEAARAKVRSRVWDLIAARQEGFPASSTCYGDLGATIVIRLDATLVNVHPDKAGARGRRPRSQARIWRDSARATFRSWLTISSVRSAGNRSAGALTLMPARKPRPSIATPTQRPAAWFSASSKP